MSIPSSGSAYHVLEERTFERRVRLGPEELGRRLAPLIDGEVYTKLWRRAMFATDASPYEILPRCVVLPKDKRDVVRTVQLARENSISIVARGGGSGLVGSALGDGIVLDFTRYMNTG